MDMMPSPDNGPDNMPVSSVSWIDAVNFCNRLSAKESIQPYYKVKDNAATILGGDG